MSPAESGCSINVADSTISSVADGSVIDAEVVKLLREQHKLVDSQTFDMWTASRDYESWGRASIVDRLDAIIDYARQRWSLDFEERQKYATIKLPS